MQLSVLSKITMEESIVPVAVATLGKIGIALGDGVRGFKRTRAGFEGLASNMNSCIRRVVDACVTVVVVWNV